MPVTIDQPGLYRGISHDDYHADPVPAALGRSLSSSDARALLPPSCPARYRWTKDNGGRAPTRVMELGQAAHLKVLGVGPALVVIDADDYRKKKAQTERDEARAAGLTPLLAAEADTVDAMAAALTANAQARMLLAPGSGLPEQTIIWQDDATGIWCRCRIDWLRHSRPGRPLLVPDYKTCASADPASLAPIFARLGYHMQAGHYCDGIRAVYDPDPMFLFICQERTPPYLVTIVALDDAARQIADQNNAYARYLFRTCTQNNHWPAYHDGIYHMSLPRWVEAQEGIHTP